MLGLGSAAPSPGMFPHVVDIYAVDTERRDAAGGLDPVPTLVAGNVPCLVSDRRGSRRQAGQRDTDAGWVRVCFPADAGLDQGHQLRHTPPGGRRRNLRVDSYRDDLNLGRLWVAECETIDDPDA